MDISNITINVHSSIRIDIGKIIYIDPFEIEGEHADADFIFLTHDHYDHCSPDDINKVLKQETLFIVPERMEHDLRKKITAGRILAVLPGNKYETEGLTFETVPAYNLMKPFHPKKAGWVGYILDIDGTRIYIAGDTDATKEARDVKCDIAMIPIGGTYTMNYKEAAKLVNEIRPGYAIPTHYGRLAGKKSDGDDFMKLVDDGIRVELKL